MRRGLALLAFAVLSTTTACGAVTYMQQVPFNAADKVESARALNAAKFSPYWWTRATEYLRMAREVAAHADFQGANRFGRLSADAAQKAAEESEAYSRDPSKMPKNPMQPDVAPAKDGAAPAKDGTAPAKDGVAPAKDE